MAIEFDRSNDQIIAVRFPKVDRDAYDEIAKKEGVTLQEVVRKFAKEGHKKYLKENNN